LIRGNKGEEGMPTGKIIGIIGCGNMGEAIIKGILAKNLVPKSRILVSDARESRLVYIKHRYGTKGIDNASLAKKCNVLILAVKPQDRNVINEISGGFSSKKLLISILAGITIEDIKGLSRKRIQVARVMPNMGALVGESMSAVSFDKGTKKDNKRMVMRIFSALGDAVEINETHMDAVTAVSGSGPAYFFYLVETLARCAVGLGIDEKVAERLAVKTALGSAALLGRMKLGPQVLRHKITSKKGTTEAALKILEAKGFETIVRDAVAAAYKRSKELSGGK